MRSFSLVFVLLGIFGAVWMTAEGKKEPSQALLNTYRGSSFPEENHSATSNEVHHETLDSITTASPENGEESDSDYLLGTRNQEEVSLSSTESSKQQPAETPTLKPSSTRFSKADNTSLPPKLECENETLTNEIGEIHPVYEDEDKCMEWFIEYGEGYDIQLTVKNLDLDDDAHDYLKILADKNQQSTETTHIFTRKVTKKMEYNVKSTGKAYVLFVTHKTGRRKPEGFHLEYSRSGELNTTTSTTTAPAPLPPNNKPPSITIYVKFNSTLEYFKEILAERANEFCNTTGDIPLEDEVTKENVSLSVIERCPEGWNCTKIQLAIAVNTNLSSYELSSENLQKMWINWTDEEKEKYGIEFQIKPPHRKEMWIWFGTLIGLIIAFSVFLTYLWQCQLNSEHKEDPKVSVASTAYDVPPLFDYMDDKLDDPEYLPNYNSPYYLNSETSTDDVKYSYGTLPGFKYGSTPFRFNGSTKDGYDNQTFLDDDDEFEVMNRNSLTQGAEANKKRDSSITDKRTSNGTNDSKSGLYYEIPNTVEEATL